MVTTDHLAARQSNAESVPQEPADLLGLALITE
jgi:hypothetical protein